VASLRISLFLKIPIGSVTCLRQQPNSLPVATMCAGLDTESILVEFLLLLCVLFYKHRTNF